MGPRDAVWGEWARAHGKCCKVTFLILLALSLCLLIGGGIMMATNQDTNIFDHDDDDYDWVQEFERNTRFTGGIVMAVLGVMFLMAAFLAMCCAFQMGCLRRAAEAHNTQQHQQQQPQAYVHQGQVQPPPPGAMPAPPPPAGPYYSQGYPPQPYPQQPGYPPQAYLPPQPQAPYPQAVVQPPPMPPSYAEAGKMPTAPPPPPPMPPTKE